MKKKIIKILTIGSLLSAASIVSSDTNFRYKIPQPSQITQDYDGDNIPNNYDPDDDNDGIIDENDSTPFGQPNAASSTPLVSGITSFTSDVSTIFAGQTVNFSWSIDKPSNLTLFGGDFSVAGYGVTGLNVSSDEPNSSSTYTLMSDTGYASVSVDVLPIPLVNIFNADNISIDDGDSVTLSWDISNAVNPTISGGNLPANTSINEVGNIIDTPTEDTIYSIYDGYDTTSLNVEVVEAAPVVIGSGNYSFTIGNSNQPYTGYNRNPYLSNSYGIIGNELTSMALSNGGTIRTLMVYNGGQYIYISIDDNAALTESKIESIQINGYTFLMSQAQTSGGLKYWGPSINGVGEIRELIRDNVGETLMFDINLK
jgi:hypothetical protein